MSDLMIKDDKYCFACGPLNPIGLRMKVERGGGRARAELSLKQEHQGWKDMAHGGLVATVLDEIMAHAVVSEIPKAVTVDLQVRYKSAAPLNTVLLATGRIREQNSRVAVAEGELKVRDTGQLIARAESKFLLIK